MRWLAAAALALAPAALHAQQDLPALYDVSGVAADDVLNIRAAPSASAPVMGALPPGRQGVEVVTLAPGGSWGQVNSDEGSGWVAMRYMALQPGQEGFAAPAACFGTEPFWSLTRDGTAWRFDAPDRETRDFVTTWQDMAAGRRDRQARGLRDSEGTGEATAVIARGACSDGMSDRAYGLTLDLLIDGQGASSYFTGCCTLER